MTQDEEEGAMAERRKTQSGKGQVLLMGVVVFVAVMLAEMTAPFVVPLIHGTQTSHGAGTVTAAGDGAAFPTDQRPALYTPLDPPLLANFTEDDGTTRYLQLGLQVMSREQDSIDAVQQHAPALRNAFLFLIANHSYNDIVTREGKEVLRAEMLEEARAILLRNTGKPGIEQVFFTSFIVQ